MHGTKLKHMTKNETKDNDLPCHTQWIHGVGGGVGGKGWVELDEKRLKFQLRAASTRASSHHHYLRSNTI
jgi:hypothetical protein